MMPTITRRGRWRSVVGGLALAVATAMPWHDAIADEDPAIAAADAALGRWDVATATRALADAPEGDAKQIKLATIAIYEGRYADAESILTEAIAGGRLEGNDSLAEDARHHLALARGAQKALGAALVVESDDGHVQAVFADAKDAVLAPYLFDAMAKARAVLGTELGVLPDHAVRFEFLDDPTKLAMVTPLTVANIRTTGTVGVTKHRRVVMITPRVMLRGYGWLDTAVHEYVHYLLTLRTGNLAPVWLQEGLAKLYETRWRRSTPEPLAPAIAFRLHQAIVRDDLVTLEEMYPSVAMLPSAELAALAYAEVETMLGLLRERRGTTGITTLLDRVLAGDDAKTALATAWGDDFEAFETEWKRVTKTRTAKGRAGEIDTPEFGAPKDPDAELGDVFSELGGGKARQHARLGALLQGRGHLEAAAQQYEKARNADKRARRDATLCRRLGRLYVTLERWNEAAELLTIAAAEEPDDANLAAAQGRALLRSGKPAAAIEAIDRAIRNNPFVPTVHCDLAELTTDSAVAARERALCKP
jgi:tetratricopeptide (TPR) repeat protein